LQSLSSIINIVVGNPKRQIIQTGNLFALFTP
jgi:hypothetical protein